MKKTIKNILLTISLILVSIGVITATVYGAVSLSSSIGKKHNQFDIDKDGFLALSYHPHDSDDKLTNVYIATDNRKMWKKDSFVPGDYRFYHADSSKCFEYKGIKNCEVISREVKDQDDNPVQANPLCDKFFDTMKGYPHELIGDINFYDFKDAIVVSYMPNVVSGNYLEIGYFSNTYLDWEVTQVETEKIESVKLYRVK